ncbi:hypothetical protein MLD38_025657 [Melastoma candidum]|uniref:Uncharacterized protein n=1 Tax=Melastoma candidum TaxID=119954 RepID=A0ACB9NVS0_9MYRT|nr:hypothetical protein MLD38_025657 [Melastoma candidum]
MNSEGRRLRPGSALANIKILLVDDDSTILTIVSTLLTMLNHEVTTATSALDALSILRVDNVGFDLVVTDHHMPGMHGLQLLERVREEFRIPVIVISADERKMLIRESLERGAASFINKPVKPEDLQDIWRFAKPTRNARL